MTSSEDLRYLGERIDNLREALSEVGRGVHAHLDQLEDMIRDAVAPPKWWVRPLQVGLFLAVFVMAIGILGWFMKEQLLPEATYNRLMDVGMRRAGGE